MDNVILYGDLDIDDIIMIEMTKSQEHMQKMLNIASEEPIHHQYNKFEISSMTDEECLFEFRFKKEDLFRFA